MTNTIVLLATLAAKMRIRKMVSVVTVIKDDMSAKGLKTMVKLHHVSPFPVNTAGGSATPSLISREQEVKSVLGICNGLILIVPPKT